MGAETLTEVSRLRDEAALALTEFRAAATRQTVAVEPDSLTRLLKGSAGAGAALISLCLAAITLWSRLFPA